MVTEFHLRKFHRTEPFKKNAVLPGHPFGSDVQKENRRKLWYARGQRGLPRKDSVRLQAWKRKRGTTKNSETKKQGMRRSRLSNCAGATLSRFKETAENMRNARRPVRKAYQEEWLRGLFIRRGGRAECDGFGLAVFARVS
jgi:hypothetical protein